MIHSINNFQLSLQKKFLPKNCDFCEDQIVGKLVLTKSGGVIKFKSKNNNSKNFGLLCKSTLKKSNNQERISIKYNSKINNNSNYKLVVILESPHTEEYKVDPIRFNFKTAPAWGNSGSSFDKNFINVLNANIINIKKAFEQNQYNKDIDVYLVNAIQYQCSLGKRKINRALKDKIFFMLWNTEPDSFLMDLVERIDFINPNLIINACTLNLQRLCCNASKIFPLLKNRNVIFLSSSNHISKWSINKTFII